MKNYEDQSSKIFDEKLKKCNSINEVINVVNEFYDLDAPLGVMTKSIVVNGVLQLIKMIKVVKRSLPNFK